MTSRSGIVFIAALAVLLRGPVRAADCADCDGNGSVRIEEVITGIAIALGTQQSSVCPAIDRSGDGLVTIGELIAAVADALTGCAPEASPTPTPKEETTATATPSPSPIPDDQVPPTDDAALDAWLQAGRYLGWQAESAPHPGAGPHFGVVRTFVNDALFASLSAGATQHPAGAAAVKELYGGSGTTVRGWAVMRKLQDDSDRGRGWYWYEAFGGSGSGSIGNPGCTGCHAAGKDFVRIPFPLQ